MDANKAKLCQTRIEQDRGARAAQSSPAPPLISREKTPPCVRTLVGRAFSAVQSAFSALLKPLELPVVSDLDPTLMFLSSLSK